MKSLNVLVSTMNRNNLDFFREMNIKVPAIIVNQFINDDTEEIDIIKGDSLKFINTSDKGVSNSRNLLLEHSESDISVIADDDLVYEDNFDLIVKTAYQQFPDAHVIVFQVPRTGDNSDVRAKSYPQEIKQLNYLTSMKVSAVEITFKTKSVKDHGIKFNPNIGAGTEFMMGEENQFLFDCLRAGLKIMYLPYQIATVDVSESTWFKGFDRDYFISTGAKFYNMTNTLYPLLIAQFAVRKRDLYSDNFTFKEVLKLMHDGVKLYKKKYE